MGVLCLNTLNVTKHLHLTPTIFSKWALGGSTRKSTWWQNIIVLSNHLISSETMTVFKWFILLSKLFQTYCAPLGTPGWINLFLEMSGCWLLLLLLLLLLLWLGKCLRRVSVTLIFAFRHTNPHVPSPLIFSNCLHLMQLTMGLYLTIRSSKTCLA